MADFTGFYFNHIHSSTYNIYRTSNGSRFEEGLIPDFENYSVSVAGGHGDIYQGQKYKPIPFKIQIAFDSMTEENLRNLRSWIETEDLKPLQFDERPYKTYFAKLSSRPILNYVCFSEEEDIDGYSGGPTDFTPIYDGFSKNPPAHSPNEPQEFSFTTSPITVGNKRRIYKGEGEFNFIAYDPFGYCADDSNKMTIEYGLRYTGKTNWQFLDEYIPPTDWDAANDEWGKASGLLTERKFKEKNINVPYQSTEDSTEGTNVYYIPLYNPGDKPANIQIFFDINNGTEKITEKKIIDIQLQVPRLKNYWNLPNEIPESYYEWLDKGYSLSFNTQSLFKNNHILLNSKDHTVKVYPSLDMNKIYDMRYDLIENSNWTEVPQGRSRLKISVPNSIIGQKFKIEVKYNYKYY